MLEEPLTSMIWSAETRTIKKAKAGDTAAFAALYDRHAPLVYRFLFRLTGNTATAEDLTQDTFLAAFQSLPDWRGEGKLSTYLCGIAFRRYTVSRRRILPTEDLDDSLPTSHPDDDPLASLTHKEAEQAMARAIADLPDLSREVYVLIRVEGMSYKEAAAILDVPIGTVQSRLWRATRFLQTALAPHLSDPGVVTPPSSSPDLKARSTV